MDWKVNIFKWLYTTVIFSTMYQTFRNTWWILIILIFDVKELNNLRIKFSVENVMQYIVFTCLLLNLRQLIITHPICWTDLLMTKNSVIILATSQYLLRTTWIFFSILLSSFIKKIYYRIYCFSPSVSWWKKKCNLNANIAVICAFDFHIRHITFFN